MFESGYPEQRFGSLVRGLREVPAKSAHQRAAAIEVMGRERPVRQPAAALAFVQGRERIDKRHPFQHPAHTHYPDAHRGTDSKVLCHAKQVIQCPLAVPYPPIGIAFVDFADHVHRSHGKRLAGVEREGFFGWKNIDKEEIQTDAFTVKFEHDFNDNLRLQNLSRYSQVKRDTVISASHVNLAVAPAGQYRPAGPQGYGRDVTSEMWINQTNLTAYFDTFGLGHTLVSGVEISREDYDRNTYSYGLDFAGRSFDLGNPPGYYTGSINKARSAETSTQLDNEAVYVFDTIALNEQWDLSLGLRYDWIKGDSKNVALPAGTVTRLDSRDKELSGRAGVVYKPAENGRIYLAYGTSFNPAAEALASSGALNAAAADLAPEENETWELGTKWELLNSRLQLDAAVFRVEKTNARETMVDGSTQLAGEQRVQGVEFGVTGRITDQWNVYANYTFLDSETLKAADTAAGIAREGQALGNTPPRSFNLWTTYELPAGWRVGYGARYASERNVTSSDNAKLDAYWVHNAMLGYQVNKELDLQLNMNNLFDKDYVQSVRQNVGLNTRSSAIEYGDARSAVLSATYRF